MKVTPEIAALIAQLEYEIGRECYNPNSYDGYTGVEGAAFRYPVTIYQDDNLRKYRYVIPAISPDEVNTTPKTHFQPLFQKTSFQDLTWNNQYSLYSDCKSLTS